MKRHVWQRWLGHGTWAVADQGLFALANALLNILVARWLIPAEYGAFAVAYSMFLLFGAFHNALFTEPMLVFAPSRYADRSYGYLRVLLCGHWVLTGAGGLLLGGAGVINWFFGSRLVAHALFGLAAAAPFTLLVWLTKRASYARLRPQLAAIQSVLYLIVLIVGLFALESLKGVSIFSVMMVMGFSSAVSGWWLIWRLHANVPHGAEPLPRRGVLTDHWNYGRWALATAVLAWVPLNFYFVVLSAWVNLEASATLKALTNLLLPLLQANAALAALLLPLMVRRASDRSEFRHLLSSALATFSAGALLYAFVVAALGGRLVHLLYGGKYDGFSHLLWLLAFIPVLDGVTVVLASALRSLQRPNQVFWAYLFGASCVPIGILAAVEWGVKGAVCGMALAGLIGVVRLGGAVLAHLRIDVPAKPLLAVKSIG